MTVPAMPVVKAHNRLFMTQFALALNPDVHYGRFFGVIPAGTAADARRAFSQGFFVTTKAMNPPVKTLAIVGTDAESSRNASEGARDNAKAAEGVGEEVQGAGTPDDDKLAACLHSHAFHTQFGDIRCGADGDWSDSRIVFEPFHDVKGNNADHFRDGRSETILAPTAMRSGTLIAPYSDLSHGPADPGSPGHAVHAWLGCRPLECPDRPCLSVKSVS